MEIFSAESLDANMLDKFADKYECCLICNGDVLAQGKYSEIIESVPDNLKKKTYATFVVEHEGHKKLFMFTLEYNDSIDELYKLYENVEDPINGISPATYNKAIILASELPFYGFNESLEVELPRNFSPLYRRVIECLQIKNTQIL